MLRLMSTMALQRFLVPRLLFWLGPGPFVFSASLSSGCAEQDEQDANFGELGFLPYFETSISDFQLMLPPIQTCEELSICVAARDPEQQLVEFMWKTGASTLKLAVDDEQPAYLNSEGQWEHCATVLGVAPGLYSLGVRVIDLPEATTDGFAYEHAPRRLNMSEMLATELRVQPGPKPCTALWSREYQPHERSATGRVAAAQFDNVGNLLAVFHLQGEASRSELRKYDRGGDTQWSTTLPESLVAESITQLESGDLVALVSNDNTSSFVWSEPSSLWRFRGDGVLLDIVELDSGLADASNYAIDVDRDGDLYVAGRGRTQPWLAKMDDLGNVHWQQPVDKVSHYGRSQMFVAGAGIVVRLGGSQEAANGPSLHGFSLDGQLQWQTNVPIQLEDFRLAEAPSGGFLVAGSTSAQSFGRANDEMALWLGAYDMQGEIAWSTAMPSGGYLRLLGLAGAADGQISVAGATRSGELWRTWLARYSSDGKVLGPVETKALAPRVEPEGVVFGAGHVNGFVVYGRRHNEVDYPGEIEPSRAYLRSFSR